MKKLLIGHIGRICFSRLSEGEDLTEAICRRVECILEMNAFLQFYSKIFPSGGGCLIRQPPPEGKILE